MVDRLDAEVEDVPRSPSPCPDPGGRSSSPDGRPPGQAGLSLPPPRPATKQALRAEALGRIDAGGPLDAAALAVWSAAETHAHIRDYLRRTLGK